MGVLYQVGTNLPYFALGVVARVWVPVALRGPRWRSVTFAVAAYGLLAVGVYAGGEGELLRPAKAVLGIAATLALAGSLVDSRLFVWVKRWGEDSLAIFLAHTFASAGFRIVVQKMFHISDPVVHLVGGVVVGLYGPILLNSASRWVRFNYLFAWPAAKPKAVPSTQDNEKEDVRNASPTAGY